MWLAVCRRFAARAANRIERQISRSLSDADDFARRNAERLMQRLELQHEETVRVRSDDRAIFVVRHPRFGRCVLKTTLAVRRPADGLASLALARHVAEVNAPIFPAVWDAGPDFTLEAFVEGHRFRAWMERDFQPSSVEAYLEDLRRWSEGPGPWQAADEFMSADEIKAIIWEYVQKCLSHRRFFAAGTQISALRRLQREVPGLRRDLDWLVGAAERVRIRRGMMCGDMGNVNLIVQHATGRIYNIDYEFMGPGHRGFDCAYLLSALAKMGESGEALDSIRRLVLSENYLGAQECVEFFEVYARLLTAISRAVYQGEPSSSAPSRSAAPLADL